MPYAYLHHLRFLLLSKKCYLRVMGYFLICPKSHFSHKFVYINTYDYVVAISLATQLSKQCLE